MPRAPKRPRSDEEVADLAASLRVDWQAGDRIETWLRRHVDELTAIVRDQGWSWHDVGRALHEAGIHYGTGRPWSAAILRKKATVARGRTAKHRAPTDAIAVAVRDALVGLGGKVGQVVFNLPGAVLTASPPIPTAQPSAVAEAQVATAGRGHIAPSSHQQISASEEEADLPFAPAKLKGWNGSKPEPKVSADPKTTSSAPAAKHDADEVLRRLHGKDTA